MGVSNIQKHFIVSNNNKNLPKEAQENEAGADANFSLKQYQNMCIKRKKMQENVSSA